MAFKKELVRQFFAMRTELMKQQTYRLELKPVRRELTDVIQEVDNGRWAYKKYTDLAYPTAVYARGIFNSSPYPWEPYRKNDLEVSRDGELR